MAPHNPFVPAQPIRMAWPHIFCLFLPVMRESMFGMETRYPDIFQEDFMEFGFVRETREMAEKAGTDETGVVRTGLEDYLAAIYPDVRDWVHDKPFGEHGGKRHRIRPDYLSESLRTVIEFDGVQHYQKPEVILRDMRNTETYESSGYKVIRLPFFVNLTRGHIIKLFGVDTGREMCPLVHSFNSRITPACFCPAGIKRMREILADFPDQREVEMEYLRTLDPLLSGVEFM